MQIEKQLESPGASTSPLARQEQSSQQRMELTVNHPPHYNKGKFETIDVIDDIAAHHGSDAAYIVGCIIKYISRAPFKGNYKEDIRKAQWYMNRLVDKHG